MKTTETMDARGIFGRFSAVDQAELQAVEGGVTSGEWGAIRPVYLAVALLNPLLMPGFLVGDAIYP